MNGRNGAIRTNEGLVVRYFLAALIALALATTVSCGRSSDEQRYLDVLQQKGSQVQLTDPSGKLAAGHAVCDGLRNTKPGKDRDYARYALEQSPQFGFLIVTTATDTLCPDMAQTL